MSYERSRRKWAVAALIAAASGMAAAPFSHAQAQTPAFCEGRLGEGGALPRASSSSFALSSVVVVCHGFFAVGFDKDLHEPRWAAERLTKASVRQAQALHGRPRRFHDDPLVPGADQYHTRDYRLLNYDRGHLAPSGDMPEWGARTESFSMTNIVPQDIELNSGPWNALEASIRAQALHLGENGSVKEKDEDALYVVTGTGFAPPNSNIGRVAGPRRMRVPDYMWKGLLEVRAGEARAPRYVLCVNATPSNCQDVSAARIQEVSGIVPFPGLAPALDKDKDQGTDKDKEEARP